MRTNPVENLPLDNCLKPGKPLKVCFIGWGAIAKRAGQLLIERNIDSVEIVAIAVKDSSKHLRDLPANAELLSAPEQLAEVDADIVIEAAVRPCVGEWAKAALRSGADFMISSTSAFCDETLLAELVEIAEYHGQKIIVPPGALGGIDALGAAAVMQLQSVEHTIIKPPKAWAGTPAEESLDLASLETPATFFSGTARQAADAFPKNANVAIISAMAGVGLDETTITLVADPTVNRNTHRISAIGDFGRLDVCLENAALKSNPKSSEMTALNIVRSVESQSRALVC